MQARPPKKECLILASTSHPSSASMPAKWNDISAPRRHATSILIRRDEQPIRLCLDAYVGGVTIVDNRWRFAFGVATDKDVLVDRGRTVCK